MTERQTHTAPVERALGLFSELLEEDEVLLAELSTSRDDFFGPAAGTVGADGERRFREWFLFERPLEGDGRVAARALAEAFLQRASGDLAGLMPGLLESHVGIYEVTAVELGRGLWVSDMLGGGQYPLEEPEAAGEFVVGDLLIGRLFPAGTGAYRASTAAACVRHRSLSDALRRDVEAARSQRRGVPRVSQQALEAMFFQGGGLGEAGAEGARVTKEELDRRVSDCRAWLVERGVSEADVDEIFQALAAESFDAQQVAPGLGDVLAGILSDLAFHTNLDLGEARARLLAVWTGMWAPVDAPAKAGEPRVPGQSPSPESQPLSAREALAAFDEARAAGGDLDAVFEQLERDLGLEPGASEEDEVTALDFPGVVGAMVEEYLWERRTNGSPEADPSALRRLAEYGAHIGAFEDLTSKELAIFTGCWLIERGALGDASAARSTLSALEGFCRWAESEHEHQLWTTFGSDHAELTESLPRLVRANASLTPPESKLRVLLFEVSDEGDLRRVDGDTATDAVPTGLASDLRPGDLVRASRSEGGLHVHGCYPRVVLDVLRAQS